jgi:predicted enzyme related to lactoylglutathione lyase
VKLTTEEVIAIGEELEERAMKIALASDFHKEVFGFRPKERYQFTDDDWVAAYDAAKARFDGLMSTPEGRDALRADGWIVEEVRS